MRSINPSNGATLASYSPLESDGVLNAIASAHRAFGEWKTSGLAARRERISRLGDVLLSHQAKLAELTTLEMGKPIVEARAEIDKCARLCRYYASHGENLLDPAPVVTEAAESYVRFDPLGPILGIMPWNYPVWQVIRFAVPTLLAGNTILLKHAPNVCGTALALEACFREAGFAEGEYTALVVEVEHVEEILADPRVAGVSLTGSVGAGRAVGEIAGRYLKPCLLELGGSDPFIVLSDADLDEAASAAATSRFLNSGQSCIAAKRLLVEDAVHDAFVERLGERISALAVDDPINETTRVGPLARPDLLSQLHAQVTGSVARGAKLVMGGKPIERAGNFYEPTLLTEVTQGMAVFDEETFGPVASVTRVQGEQALVTMANATRYGLGAAVFSRGERGRAFIPQLEAGHIAINTIVKSDPRLPFGGIKHSGYGRELAREGVLAFTNTKTVWIQR